MSYSILLAALVGLPAAFWIWRWSVGRSNTPGVVEKPDDLELVVEYYTTEKIRNVRAHLQLQ